MKTNSAFILLLLSVGLFFTFTNSQYQQVKELQATASQYNDVLDNSSAIISQRDRLRMTYEAIPRTEIDRLEKVLPDNIDTVRLALELDNLASRYDIALQSIQTTVEAENASEVVLPEYSAPYDKATVSFSFISDYEGFMNFMRDIEMSLRIMDVESISFQATDTGLYDYQVAVNTYWLK